MKKNFLVVKKPTLSLIINNQNIHFQSNHLKDILQSLTGRMAHSKTKHDHYPFYFESKS